MEPETPQNSQVTHPHLKTLTYMPREKYKQTQPNACEESIVNIPIINSCRTTMTKPLVSEQDQTKT